MSDDDLIRDLAGLRSNDAPDDIVGRALADAAFVAAQRDAPVPSEMLLARIARDARAEAARRRRFDWMTWGGLAAACIIGLAVGLTDLPSLATGDLAPSYAVEDLGGGYEFQFAEVDL